MKDPIEELTGIYFSLWSWDISLTLNMTIGIKDVTAFAVAYFFILSFFIKKIISYSVKIVDNCKLNVLYSCK